MFWAKGNPWILPPAHIIEEGNFETIERYLIDAKQQEQERSWKLRVMLLGSSGAGKTSLMRSVTTGKASCTGCGDVSSVGIEMESWKPMGEDPPLVVSFWDFAGQEEYYAYHQLFITPGTLCLLVVDLTLTTKSNDKLMQWVDALLARVPDCCVVLVGTHSDMLAPEAVTERMRCLEDSIKHHVAGRKGEAEWAQKRDAERAKYRNEAEHAGSAGGTMPSSKLQRVLKRHELLCSMNLNPAVYISRYDGTRERDAECANYRNEA
ncbi:unnamed protein product, partial [Chrysoparadoxa australica]